jgi:predicted O-methyltransferase YrrM
MIERAASGARTVVEIGTWEGGSAVAILRSLAADGRLYCVDPYPRATLGRISASQLVARRTTRRLSRGRLTWLRADSSSAERGWTGPIDLLLIDGLHTPDGVDDDWRAWARHVGPDGLVVFRHDVFAAPSGWIVEDAGPSLALARRRST